jgi:hypothetical protein
MKRTFIKNILLAVMSLALFPAFGLTEQYIIAEIFCRTDSHGITRITLLPPEDEKPFWIRLDEKRWMTVRGVPKERVAELLQRYGTGAQLATPEAKPVVVKSGEASEKEEQVAQQKPQKRQRTRTNTPLKRYDCPGGEVLPGRDKIPDVLEACGNPANRDRYSSSGGFTIDELYYQFDPPVLFHFTNGTLGGISER